MRDAASRVTNRRTSRSVSLLLVVNALIASAMVALDGENWVVSGPLFTVVGALAFWVICLTLWVLSLLFYLLTGNLEPVGSLWSAAWSGGPEPFRSALGVLALGVVGTWAWSRYGSRLRLDEGRVRLIVVALLVVPVLMFVAGGIWLVQCWLHVR